MGWHAGPVEADLGGVAKIDLPDGYASLNRKDTRKFIELVGNISNESQVGLIVPRDSTSSWFLVFSFDLCGYVKDDEKQELDPGTMLESIRSGEESNKLRVEKGLKPIHAVGWKTEPRYNAATNNLEWCLILESDEGQSLNHHIRILGRTGVMKAIVVAGEEELDAARAATSMLLTRFQYREGNRYAEWTAGDKVAKYGLPRWSQAGPWLWRQSRVCWAS